MVMILIDAQALDRDFTVYVIDSSKSAIWGLVCNLCFLFSKEQRKKMLQKAGRNYREGFLLARPYL